jgi:hypothetical protein
MSAPKNNSETVIEYTSQMQVPAGELEKGTSDYVKNKIKAHKSHKRASQSSRARKEITAKLAKIIKKAALIGELLTENDQAENLRVIREAKQACHVYITKKGEIKVPDHKTQLAAVTLDLAYREGKPVERAEVLHGDAKDFPTLLKKLQQSEAYKALQISEQKTFEDKGITRSLPEPPAKVRQ